MENAKSEIIHPPVALISMPWMSVDMPSIQLATVGACLSNESISNDRYELFLDYAERIGVRLYRFLSNYHDLFGEWIFSRNYFLHEENNDLRGFLRNFSLGINTAYPQETVIRALEVVTDEYLTDMLELQDWSKYKLVGFSVTIAQLGPSIALARLIKLRHPNTTIFFGGSSCAGVMGRTMLKIFPYIDIVVHSEAEYVLPKLVQSVISHGEASDQSLIDINGISWRNSKNREIQTTQMPNLYKLSDRRYALSFDSYFERLEKLDLQKKLDVWIPFEGSRGCWYGEKTQCTFCGLHEIMEYRTRQSKDVLDELERLSLAYSKNKFFAVDLIIPRDFVTTLLPDIISRGHNWEIFYEIKSSISKKDLISFSQAGIRWVQPGIENLQGDMLKLMKKGVTPSHNIQLLKWCKTLDVKVVWNIIVGLPGEQLDFYDQILSVIPMLYHLPPPSGASPFSLHRFSPYFNDPKTYGITYVGAHHRYKHIFPIAEQDLNDLVYKHDFMLSHDNQEISSKQALLKHEIEKWKMRYCSGAILSIHLCDDGSSVVLDSRLPGKTIEHTLNPFKTRLYLQLESRSSVASFKRYYRMYQSYSSNDACTSISAFGADQIIDQWLADGLVVKDEKHLLGLATGLTDVA